MSADIVSIKKMDYWQQLGHRTSIAPLTTRATRPLHHRPVQLGSRKSLDRKSAVAVSRSTNRFSDDARSVGRARAVDGRSVGAQRGNAGVRKLLIERPRSELDRIGKAMFTSPAWLIYVKTLTLTIEFTTRSVPPI